jgi:DNA-binding MarR family transcriptional regulator
MRPDSPEADLVPLSALLSQALVAFTIEFDNEAERQIPHRTSDHGGTQGAVWLVSMAMWLNCMRYVGEDPITVGELRRRARGDTNLAGMQRWGYITVEPDPAGLRPKPRQADLLVRATRKGLLATEVWQPLTVVVQQRWKDRYGAAQIELLGESLQNIAGLLGDWLPDCLPILGYGLFSRGSKPREDRYAALQSEYELDPPTTAGNADGALALPWLLARVLLALAIEFEQESGISLAIAANVLRLLDEHGTRVKDLPLRSGVSTEGLAMATGYLAARGLAVVGAGPAGEKWKLVRLTAAGSQVRATSQDLLASIEGRWRARYGAEAIDALRDALETLAGRPRTAGAPGGPQSPLFAAIEPYPDGWRAAVRRPVTLPYYPLVLHRGGYPDGS